MLPSPALRLAARTEQVDAIVRAEWPELAGAALVAVGGYGRSDLYPHSDIDLLIVSSRNDLREAIAPFYRNLWDAGLRVSQSVRSVPECLRVDPNNIEFSVSLLDRRWIAGDRSIFDKLRNAPADDLAPALAELTRKRHRAFGNTIFHLEPNVKESPGGLRDVLLVHWMRMLKGSGPEVPEHALLQRLRQALHDAAHRDQNTLNFEMQDALAASLGYATAAELMRDYYRECARVFRAASRSLEPAESRRGSVIANLRHRAKRISNEEFEVCGGRVNFRGSHADGGLISSIFHFVARHGTPLAAEAEDQIKADRSTELLWPEFRAILEMPHANVALRAMQATGYLERLFPELRGIESLVIRDFYHRYTVDEHTLVAIDHAIDLRKSEGRFGELARETPDYALLLMALLFHDAGKGERAESREAAGQDHAEASAEIADRVSANFGIEDGDKKTLRFLIENHLEMPRLMTTRDMRDQQTPASLAALVGTVERLRMLTVLSYCDVSAVSPGAMTPWRSILLWQLYVATNRHLTRELQEHTASEGMPVRYALTNTPEEIQEHRRMELEGPEVKLDAVSGHHRLTVVTHDRPFLFADIAGAISGFGMNILRAEAFVNERRTAIDTFVFADPMRSLELNRSEADRMCAVVRDVLGGRRRVSDLLRGRPLPKRGWRDAPKVSTDNTACPDATLVEISAHDRPGLLYEVARVFSEAGCNIETVLVDTEGHKAIDVFYISRDGARLGEQEALRLRDAVHATAG